MHFRSALFSSVLLSTACAHETHEFLFGRDLPLPVAANAENYADCANAAWPPSNVGIELVPQAPDDEMRAIVDEISAANIEATIKKLVTFGTRHTLATYNSSTRGIHAARDWIASEMRTYAAQSNGTMTVEVQSYTQEVASRIPFPVVISNVLATAKGRKTPGRVYVMTGHYDSRVTDVLNYADDSPGANDDASGTASMCIHEHRSR
jgi:Zn-dependent M28 family amino/carboxypeptidase